MVDVKWAFIADYVETCNCNYGCPCNFSGFPTNNKCEALVGYHIRQGHYGAVALDGLDCIYAGAWPNPIHEGNGTATLFITEQASPAQRDALTAILMGQAGGEGPFALFAGTITGSVAKFDFWGKIRKSGINNSMTYRPPNTRKSNFATEPPRALARCVCSIKQRTATR